MKRGACGTENTALALDWERLIPEWIYSSVDQSVDRVRTRDSLVAVFYHLCAQSDDLQAEFLSMLDNVLFACVEE